MEQEQTGIKMFLRRMKIHPAVRALVPLEAGSGLPALDIRQGCLCVQLPFFREQFAPADRTLVYPISYVATALWSTGRMIEVISTEFLPAFEGVELGKPVGTFRHEAVRHLNKTQYEEERERLFAGYDLLVRILTTEEEYSAGNERDFSARLNLLLEPSLKPFYRLLFPGFSNRFIREGAK